MHILSCNSARALWFLSKYRNYIYNALIEQPDVNLKFHKVIPMVPQQFAVGTKCTQNIL